MQLLLLFINHLFYPVNNQLTNLAKYQLPVTLCLFEKVAESVATLCRERFEEHLRSVACKKQFKISSLTHIKRNNYALIKESLVGTGRKIYSCIETNRDKPAYYGFKAEKLINSLRIRTMADYDCAHYTRKSPIIYTGMIA